ncbi:lactose-binding lectin l-2-like [Aulostomus maculatus]
MLLPLLLFGVALAAESPSGDPEVKLQRGNCPLFWYSFRDRCYKYIATQMTWADAELHCLSEGANLVSIHSVDEDKFVTSLIKNFDPVQGFTWIGLSDTQKEGAWMWSDGTAVDFTSWNEGQPDNTGGAENCVHTNLGNLLIWNDHQCSQTFPSVCASRI